MNESNLLEIDCVKKTVTFKKRCLVKVKTKLKKEKWNETKWNKILTSSVFFSNK